MDGTIQIEVVLTNVDQSCSLSISSLRDAECANLRGSSIQSKVPMVLVVGISAGVGGLLLVVIVVAVVVSLVAAAGRKRRTLAVATAKAG